MQVDEIAPGLWRWTGWREPIAAEVACVYQEGSDGVVLIDALVPPEDEERFLRALDRDVARAGAAGVHVLTTSARHSRSAATLATRYDAAIWTPGAALPNGIVALESGNPGEVAFWLPTHRCLVCGDVLRRGEGDDGAELAVAGGSAAFAAAVLELGAERVLVSHGEAVRADADAVLRAALSPRPEA